MSGAKCYFKLLSLMDDGDSLDEAIEILISDGYDEHFVESAAYKIRQHLTKRG